MSSKDDLPLDSSGTSRMHSGKLAFIMPALSSSGDDSNLLTRTVALMFIYIFKTTLRTFYFLGKLFNIPIAYKSGDDFFSINELFNNDNNSGLLQSEDIPNYDGIEPDPQLSNSTHTKLVHPEIDFIWNVNHFNEYHFDGIAVSSLLTSNEFAPFCDKSLRFQMALYPNGMNADYQDYVSLYLKLVSATHNEFLQYRFSVIDINGTKRNIKGAIHKFIPDKPGYGFHQFIRRSELLDPNEGLLSDGQLTIHCSVYRILSQPHLDDNLIQMEKLSLNRTLKDFGNLWGTDKHTDVAFVVGGKELRAHKAILSARSPVFEAMFDHGIHEMKEKKNNRVEIRNGNPKVFKELLKYIYTGKISEMDTNMAAELIHLADQYHFEYLKSFCEDYLASQLTSENVNAFYQLAEKYNATQLAKQCLDFIHRHTHASFELLQDNPEFMLKAHEYLHELINNM